MGLFKNDDMLPADIYRQGLNLPDDTGSFRVAKRNKAHAKRIINEYQHFKVCPLCGVRNLLELAHLDGDECNDHPKNLAWFCPTHHKQFDAGLYPTEAIWLCIEHWQRTRGAMNFRNAHKAVATLRRSKDAKAQAQLAEAEAVFEEKYGFPFDEVPPWR